MKKRSRADGNNVPSKTHKKTPRDPIKANANANGNGNVNVNVNVNEGGGRTTKSSSSTTTTTIEAVGATSLSSAAAAVSVVDEVVVAADEVLLSLEGGGGWWWWGLGVEEEMLLGWYPFVDDHFNFLWGEENNRGGIGGGVDYDIWQLQHIHEIPTN